jgi:hypothetical protein
MPHVYSRGGNWLDRYMRADFLSKKECLKKLPKENIVETPVTIEGITGDCRSLTQRIYLEINES